MDLMLIIAAASKEALEYFNAALQELIGKSEEQTDISIAPGAEVNSSDDAEVCIIHDYQEISEDFLKELKAFLGDYLLHPPFKIETHAIRTAGFGEDRPRYNHVDGRFVDNFPWEK